VADDLLKKDTLEYFGPVAGMPGFPRALSRTLSELRMAGLEPDRLGGHAANTDLAALLKSAIDERTKTGAVDYATMLETATAELRATPSLLADRTVVRVSQLEQRHAVGRRQVQRLFARYVGVGPKWVLARYRMHDVVSVLDGGYDGPLTDLAARYGWYDQAHFIRDFTGQVGVTPGEYRAHAAAATKASAAAEA